MDSGLGERLFGGPRVRSVQELSSTTIGIQEYQLWLLPVLSQISSRVMTGNRSVHFCQLLHFLLGLCGQGGRVEALKTGISIHPGVTGGSAISHPTPPLVASLGGAGARQMAEPSYIPSRIQA